SSGDQTAEWIPPAELGWDSPLSGTAALVHPQGWNDWFPLWFRFPVKKIADLNVTSTTFGDGKPIVDHERVSVQGNAGATQTPYEQLASHKFTQPYNNGQGAGPNGPGPATPYTPADIHARFPFNGQMVTDRKSVV